MDFTTSFSSSPYSIQQPTSYYIKKGNSSSITPREQEVLHLIAHEHSTKEIAAKLHVSYETVNSHRKNMMNKLGVKNTAGLVRVAFEQGLMYEQ